jgi:hypothetical protein
MSGTSCSRLCVAMALIALVPSTRAEPSANPPALELPWGASAECAAKIATLRRDLSAHSAVAYMQAARLHERGDCVARNVSKVAEFLGEAVRLGSTAAARQLALRFAFGRGVPQSYANAGAWLSGKGVSDEGLEPWDYSIGYAYAVAGAALESLEVPQDAVEPRAEVRLVLEVNAIAPRLPALRLTGEAASVQEPLRARLAAAFDAAASRALAWLAPTDPTLLVAARVSVPLLLRPADGGRFELIDDDPLLR